MRRGEIWTVAGGGDYAGKARPAVILQDDNFDGTASITICAFTTDPTEAPLFRLPIEPNEGNRIAVVVPANGGQDHHRVERKKIGERIGRLDDQDIVRLNQAVVVFLGLAVTSRSDR